MINAYYRLMYALFRGSYVTTATTWNVNYFISTSTWEF